MKFFFKNVIKKSIKSFNFYFNRRVFDHIHLKKQLIFDN